MEKSWISPLLSIGYKRSLDIKDLYSPVPNEQAEYLTNQLEKYVFA
jgi:hypothetical protein